MSEKCPVCDEKYKRVYFGVQQSEAAYECGCPSEAKITPDGEIYYDQSGWFDG